MASWWAVLSLALVLPFLIGGYGTRLRPGESRRHQMAGPGTWSVMSLLPSAFGTVRSRRSAGKVPQPIGLRAAFLPMLRSSSNPPSRTAPDSLWSSSWSRSPSAGRMLLPPRACVVRPLSPSSLSLKRASGQRTCQLWLPGCRDGR